MIEIVLASIVFILFFTLIHVGMKWIRDLPDVSNDGAGCYNPRVRERYEAQLRDKKKILFVLILLGSLAIASKTYASVSMSISDGGLQLNVTGDTTGSIAVYDVDTGSHLTQTGTPNSVLFLLPSCTIYYACDTAHQRIFDVGSNVNYCIGLSIDGCQAVAQGYGDVWVINGEWSLSAPSGGGGGGGTTTPIQFQGGIVQYTTYQTLLFAITMAFAFSFVILIFRHFLRL
jgi:hypothetical protein